MKKTFTINISGRVFHIEEDAFEKLGDYLKKLSSYFEKQPAGQEILLDIEARIAELLQQKMTEGQEAVTDEWVDELIHRMGNPEDFMDVEDRSAEKSEPEPKKKKASKRLYRDGESRVLGGVCSGLGVYFNIDPVILRIAFALLFFVGIGVSALVYLVLWIAVPKARTTAQRLEMRGEEATITNIQRTLQEEVTEMKESFSKFNKSVSFNKGKEVAQNAGRASLSIFRRLGRLAAAVFGVLLILIGFGGFVAVLVSLAVGGSVIHAGSSGLSPEISFTGMLGYVANPGVVSLMILLSVLIIGIPLLAILFIGTKIVFRYQTNNRLIGLGAFGIWLVALVLMISIGVGQASNFSRKNSVSSGQPIECQSCKTLFLELNDLREKSDAESNIRFDEFFFVTENGQNVLAKRPRLRIESTDAEDFSYVVRKWTRGKDDQEVKKNLELIRYEIVPQDSTLVLDPLFTIGNGVKWRSQDVEVVVKVPRGKSVHLGKNLDRLYFDFDNVNNLWAHDMAEKTWEMSPEGLKLKE